MVLKELIFNRFLIWKGVVVLKVSHLGGSGF